MTRSGGTRVIAVKNAAYLPAGPATSWQTGNNRALNREYDFSYRSTSIYDAGTNTATTTAGHVDDGLNIGYVYDAASYLKEIRTKEPTTTIRAKFDYDKLGRLLARKNATNVVQESYTYDKTGNRLTSVLGTTTTYTYPSTSHRLTQVGTQIRTYEANGNLSTVGGTAKNYTYNNANRMSVASANNVVQGTYETGVRLNF